jgi:hypothetical protein
VAKKSRTPQPPRRVQAPKQRKAEAPPGQTRRRLLLGGLVAAVVAIAAAAVLAFVVLGGGGADATLRDAGCTIVKKPAQGQAHVAELEEGFEYNTVPPSTGPHFGIPAVWDVYTEPVEEIRLVHNLEHGGLIIQYGRDVPEQTVDEIVEWYRDDPNGIVVSPLPALGDKVALVAWTSPQTPGELPPPGEGVVATCPGFDTGAFDAFKDEYAFRGPESPNFPREQLQPGT